MVLLLTILEKDPTMHTGCNLKVGLEELSRIRTHICLKTVFSCSLAILRAPKPWV